jgi:hypothetical protein
MMNGDAIFRNATNSTMERSRNIKPEFPAKSPALNRRMAYCKRTYAGGNRRSGVSEEMGVEKMRSEWSFSHGNARFKQRIAKVLKRRVTPLPKGPPRKATQDRRQLNLL